MILMTTVRISDNTGVDAVQLHDVRHVVDCIANVTVSQLAQDGVMLFPREEQESDDLSPNQMVLYRSGSGYRSSNMMGYLGNESELLVIRSRFSQSDHDYFLQYLMQHVLRMPNIFDLDICSDEEDRLFMFQIFLFPFYLRAAMRKGMFRTYIHRECNDTNVQGRIDVARHIRQNVPFTGDIAYALREFSSDNPITELIRHTAEYIATQPYGAMVLHDVRHEIQLINEATPSYRTADRRHIINHNVQSPVKHAFYSEYRALQQLCIMILNHHRHGIGGNGQRIQGVLFDGAWLWEEYINLLVGDLFHHPRNKSRTGRQYLFKGGKGFIYPDFIGKNTERRIVADAKYKPSSNIHGRDYLQILAYMYRFDAKKGFFFYPEEDLSTQASLQLLSGTSFDHVQSRDDEISVTKCGYEVPQMASDYEQYTAAMRNNEQHFRDYIMSMIRS